MKIPYNDLKSQHAPIMEEIDAAIDSVIESGQFIGKEGNRFVAKFEQEFAQFVNTPHCIGCANGTDAIELALRAFGIRAGDEVIVPAQTWISTSESVSLVGATPVFADIEPGTLTIDIEDARKRLTKKTKAIIPVHLYGLPADMEAVSNFAKQHGLRVIEDCAQAHGATYKGKHVGTMGDCGTFSFFPGKNLGAMGDAGGIVTKEPELAEKLYKLRDHGRSARFDHDFEGRNSRLDGLQAAILSVKLPHLASWTKQRQAAAAIYHNGLDDLQIPYQLVPEDRVHVYHVFGIEIEQRDRVRSQLTEKGIATGVHYPMALPQLTAYAKSSPASDSYPIANAHATRTLSLPLYPGITEAQINYVLEAIAQLRKVGR